LKAYQRIEPALLQSLARLDRFWLTGQVDNNLPQSDLPKTLYIIMAGHGVENGAYIQCSFFSMYVKMAAYSGRV